MLLRKPTGGAGRLTADEPAAQDVQAAKDVPALVEWLTVRQWEDGSKRETGTIMVLAEDGVFKAWLHDRDAARSMWVSAGSLTDLLLKVEELIAAAAGEWRPDRKPSKKT